MAPTEALAVNHFNDDPGCHSDDGGAGIAIKVNRMVHGGSTVMPGPSKTLRAEPPHAWWAG